MMLFAMRYRGTYIRSISLFVVAFLCLNPAAVFCLAYCNLHGAVSAAAHCPHKKQGSDCHNSKKAPASQTAASFDNASAKGCVIPVNVIAVPFESKFGMVVDVVAASEIKKPDHDRIVSIRSRQTPKFYYRPPPNDSRKDRVRNQVFRI